jgi:hypothetical protein
LRRKIEASALRDAAPLVGRFSNTHGKKCNPVERSGSLSYSEYLLQTEIPVHVAKQARRSENYWHKHCYFSRSQG